MAKLYFLHDTKSGVDYYPRFAENKDVMLRLLATELRVFREQKAYSVIASWNDSKLFEFDMETETKSEIEQFRNLFSPEKVAVDENKDSK